MNDNQLQRLVELKQKISDLLADINKINDGKLIICYQGYSDFFRLNCFDRRDRWTPLKSKLQDSVLQLITLEVYDTVQEIKKIIPDYEITDPVLKKIINQLRTRIAAMQNNLSQTKTILDSYADK